MRLKDQETNGAGVGDHEHRLWRQNCKYRLKNLRYFWANFLLFFGGPIPQKSQNIVVCIDRFLLFVGPRAHLSPRAPIGSNAVGNKETEGTPGSRG